jgi:transposase
MLTRDQLADILKTVSVEALHKESGVSIKTIYRLRNRTNSPTLDTAAALLAAVEKLKADATA